MPLISFEGIDGSGKTTQINRLIHWFEKIHSIKVNLFREPGGTTLSESIREILLDKSQEISPIAEMLLFSAARAHLLHEKVFPLLSNDEWVILDRFFDSTTAYQGYGRQVLSLDRIDQLNQIATQNLEPDLTFYLDINWSTSLERRKKESADRMESSGDDFFKRIIEGYRSLSNTKKRFKKLDGTKSESKIHDQITQIIQHHFVL